VNRQINIRARAERDLQSASRWYEQQAPGLGGDFISEISKAIHALASSADQHPVYYRDFRRILVKRFPYKIFYRFNGDSVTVWRILHAKQEHSRYLAAE